MRITGRFAIAGVLLLIAGVLLSGVGAQVGATSFAIGAWCLIVATASALVTGPAAVRWAGLFMLVSLGAFAYVVFAMYLGPAEQGLLLATAAACAILAVTQGIRVYLDEVALTRERATPPGPPTN